MVVVVVVAEGVEEVVHAVAAILHGDVALPLTLQFGVASHVHGQGRGHAPTIELLLCLLPFCQDEDELTKLWIET
jgi:hypothetical protein